MAINGLRSIPGKVDLVEVKHTVALWSLHHTKQIRNARKMAERYVIQTHIADYTHLRVHIKEWRHCLDVFVVVVTFVSRRKRTKNSSISSPHARCFCRVPWHFIGVQRRNESHVHVSLYSMAPYRAITWGKKPSISVKSSIRDNIINEWFAGTSVRFLASPGNRAVKFLQLKRRVESPAVPLCFPYFWISSRGASSFSFGTAKRELIKLLSTSQKKKNTRIAYMTWHDTRAQ